MVRHTPRWIVGLQIAGAVGLAAFVVHTVVHDEGRVSWFFDYRVYYGLVVLAVLLAVLRAALVRDHRKGWAVMALAVLAFAVGEFVYLLLYDSLDEPPFPGISDYFYVAFYPLSYVALILLFRSRFSAAWHDPIGRPLMDVRGRALLAVPAACGAVAAGVLVLDHFRRINLFAIVLAVLTLVGVLARLGLAFRENRQLLALTKSEAVTDALTGLGNRRRLMTDLNRSLVVATPDRPWLLVIYDLDGFKGYNDAFGHPAGDSLLARLGLAAHLEDVAALALQVGEELGLDQDALDELHRAAQLHDLGKIAIPDQILHKAGAARRRRVGVHPAAHDCR